MKNIFIIIILTLTLSEYSITQTFMQLSKTSDSVIVNKVFNSEITKNENYEKVSNTKQYKRWEWFWGQRLQGETELPNAMAIKQLAEYYKVLEKSKNNLVQSVTWEKFGPFRTPEGEGRTQGIGRMNDLAISPANENILLAGSASGGAWRSTNKGSTWTEINMTSQMTLTISDIEFSKSSPNVVYMATGDANGSFGSARDYYSVGLLKSIDGGITFFETNLYYALSENKLVTRILVHPSNPNIVLASTKNGIFRTTDGGTTWTHTLNGPFIKDMEFHPNNPNIIYSTTMLLSGLNILYKSTDNGETWNIQHQIANSRRSELAVSANKPDNIYILSSGNSNQFSSISVSTNSGETWTTLATQETAGNLLGWNDGTDLNVGQGHYDLSLAVNPKNANEIYIGGINIWKSIDGGKNWNLFTHWYGGFSQQLLHADQQQFTFDKNGTNLYVSNDGGLYRNQTGTNNWSELNNGMDITQFYRLGLSQSSSFDVIMGAQDNGTSTYNGNNWQKTYSGDGMECIIDPTNPSRRYISLPYGEIRRSTNGGVSFNQMLNSNLLKNQYGVEENGSWVTPYLVEPNNPKNIYVGYNNVWKNDNYGNSNNWTKISDFGDGTKIALTSLAISESDKNYIYSSNNTNVRMTSNGGLTWNSIHSSSNAITYIAVNPINPEEIYLTKSGYNENDKVLYYNGIDWKDISGNLPPVPINTIVVENPAIHSIYVGTDIGVFYSDLNSGYWKKLEGEMPNTIVTELEIHKASGKLYAATYGRGLWRTNLLGCDATNIPLNIIGQLEFCEGDSVILEAASVQSKYLWNTGETTKRIVVTKSGNYVLTNPNSTYCSDKSDIVPVNVFPIKDKLILSNKGPTLCHDIDNLRLSVSFTLKNVVWSTNQTSKFITITEPGIYSVKAENSNGCIVLDTIEITKSNLVNNIEIIRTANLLSVPEGYSYQWFFNDTLITESNTNVISIIENGKYKVIITDELGCSVTPNIYESLTSVNNIADNKNIKVYPNITTDFINVEIGKINSPSIEVIVFNLRGEKLKTNNFNSNSINKIDLSTFAKGVYIVKFIEAGNEYINKVILK